MPRKKSKSDTSKDESASAAPHSYAMFTGEAGQNFQSACVASGNATQVVELPELGFAGLMQRCMQKDCYPRAVEEACKEFRAKREEIHRQFTEEFKDCPVNIRTMLSLFQHMGFQLPITQETYESFCQSYKDNFLSWHGKTLSNILELPETLDEFIDFLLENNEFLSRYFIAISCETAEFMQSVLWRAADYFCGPPSQFTPHNHSDDPGDDPGGSASAGPAHLPGSGTYLSTFV